MAAPNVGSGAVISFGTHFTNAHVWDFSIDPIERPIIDVTTYGTSGGRDFITGQLYEMDLSATIWLDTSTQRIPITHTATVACTISFTNISSATMGFSAWLYRAVINPPIEERASATLSLKVSGDVTASWLI